MEIKTFQKASWQSVASLIQHEVHVLDWRGFAERLESNLSKDTTSLSAVVQTCYLMGAMAGIARCKHPSILALITRHLSLPMPLREHSMLQTLDFGFPEESLAVQTEPDVGTAAVQATVQMVHGHCQASADVVEIGSQASRHITTRTTQTIFTSDAVSTASQYESSDVAEHVGVQVEQLLRDSTTDPIPLPTTDAATMCMQLVVPREPKAVQTSVLSSTRSVQAWVPKVHQGIQHISVSTTNIACQVGMGRVGVLVRLAGWACPVLRWQRQTVVSKSIKDRLREVR